MKMLWLGVLMLACLLLSLPGLIEADDGILLKDESHDEEHMDLPHLKYSDFSDHNGEFDGFGSNMEEEHKRVEEEVLAHLKLVAEEAEMDFMDASKDIHEPEHDLELMKEDIDENFRDGYIEIIAHDEGKHGDYFWADNEEFAIHNIDEISNHLVAEEEAIAHRQQLADEADVLYEHVVDNSGENEEEMDLRSHEVNDDDIVEAEYIGRYIHGDSNAKDSKRFQKPNKISMDEALDERMALRKVAMLRRSDRDRVNKGDNPNKTTRVYLKHVQDHLRLEEAHAIFEEGSDFVEKVVYQKPERPVVHKHDDNVKFVKHDEF